jgi:hypothetical protein
MIKGVDYGNVDSRRAFPLDGRTTWVESTVAKGYVVSKDNRVLGPGEYTPGLPSQFTKHTPGPALGGSRGIVDHFHPFRSMLSTRTPGNKSGGGGGGGGGRFGGGSVGQNSVISYDDGGGSYYANQPAAYSISNDIDRYHQSNKREGMTIFHEHDRRIALDPNNRTTPTPGPGEYKVWNANPLRTMNNMSGMSEMNKSVVMGPDDVPFGERMEVKAALPDYDSAKAQDSVHFRRGNKLLTISKQERKTKFALEERRRMIEEGLIDPAVENRAKRLQKIAKLNRKYDPDESSMGLVTAQGGDNDYNRDNLASPIASKGGGGGRSEGAAGTQRAKGAQIKYPILKSRKPPALEFDPTSYRNLAISLEANFKRDQIELNPRSLNKEARVNIFNEYLALPRKHHGHRVPSRLSDKVKRAVF